MTVLTSAVSLEAPVRAPLERASRATYVVFIACGFLFASWAARIPQVRDRLHLGPADLGLVLLSIAVGSLLALPLAGAIVHRWGSRRTVATMGVLAVAAVAAVSSGYLFGIVPVIAGLFVFGFGQGAWDVAMNVQGATVERRLGRAIMPRYHAGFSVGTVAGALVGALMVAVGVPVTVHLLGVAALVGAVVPLAAQRFVPEVDDDPDGVPAIADREGRPGPVSTADREGKKVAPEPGRLAHAFRRWLEPRTLLVGLIVLAFAFAEGAGNDWINVTIIDAFDAPAVAGTLGLAAFLAAMTVARWFGTGLLDRFGRVVVLRVLAGVGIAGVVVFVLAPGTPLAVAGAILWGLGASLGFPVGMSAAADEPAAAPGRVSVVASIGYCAFLAGPPLIGFLGEHLGVHVALLSVAVLLAVSCALAGAVRPLKPHR